MRQPSWKTPITLASLLLIIGSFTYWLAYSHKPKKEKADSLTKKPLVIPEDAQIAQFRLKSSQGVIEGKCESLAKKTCKIATLGDWVLTYPIQGKADAESVKDMINNFSGMLATETIDLTDETPEKQKQLMDEYGLSDSKRTNIATQFVELTLENGKKIAAWFGEAHPMGDKTFVGSTENGVINQKTVFLIANFYKTNFEKNISHFRDKSIFNFNRSEIESFSAKTSSGKLDAKIENGLWMINGHLGDHDRIETVFSAISQLKAKEFTSGDALKGAKVIDSYSLHSKTSNPTFELFEKADKTVKNKNDLSGHPEYFIKVADQEVVYEVEPLIRAQIDKKSGELRESALLKQTEKLTGTRFTLNGDSYPVKSEFQLQGKTWVQKDKGMKLDAAQIGSFIDLLINSHAKEIVTPVPNGKIEAFTLSLGDEKNPEKSHYLFFSSKGQIYAEDLNQNAKEAYLLDTHLKSALPFKPDMWKMK